MTTFRSDNVFSCVPIALVARILSRVAGLLISSRLVFDVMLCVSTSCRVLFLDSLWHLSDVCLVRLNRVSSLCVYVLVRGILNFCVRQGSTIRLTMSWCVILTGPRNI